MISEFIYLKHTDKAKASHIARYRVHDRDKFLETQGAAARQEGGTIQIVTEADYDKSRGLR